MDFLHSSAGKESTCNAGDPSWIPELASSPGEGIGYPLQYSWASLVAQMVKEPSCNPGDLNSIPGLGRSPGGGHGKPLKCFFLENPYGQRSLVDCSPCRHKESDMTDPIAQQHSRNA